MSNKNKVIIYGLGYYWKERFDEINELYDILGCSDQDEKASVYAREYPFVSPDKILEFSYDKIILGCKKRGVREILVLKYNIPLDKILYWDEIFKENREKYFINYTEPLTIIIPTYNRKSRLKRTLDLLEIQSNHYFDVIILDNNSDYNIEELFTDRRDDFINKIKVVHNKTNIGMVANLANAFIQQMEGWIWMLADDDLPSIYAVEIIHREISRAGQTGAINFLIYDISGKASDQGRDFKSLHELLDFYRQIISDGCNERECSGDFIYFSNKVYNTFYIKQYYQQIFTYAYSGIPQLIPILFMLNEGTASLHISNEKIVAYEEADGDHWNWIKTILGMRIITDLPLNIDEKDRNLLYRLILYNYLEFLIEDVHAETADFDIRQIEKIYDEVYKYSFSEAEKIDYKNKMTLLKQKINCDVNKPYYVIRREKE